MFKLNAIVMLALGLCAVAEAIRQKPLIGRLSARQQIQPTTTSSAGYAAAGIKPDTPFELPTESVTSQPDEVYGPPEFDDQLPREPEISNVQPDEFEVQPDEIYGPPEDETVPEIVEIEDETRDVVEDLDEVDEEVIIDENGAVISVSSSFERPARLVYQRFPRRQTTKPIAARLTKAINPARFIYAARF